MATENKTIDLTIDENVPYSLLLAFTDENTDVFPVTATPIDLTGFTLRGTIKNSLESNAITIVNFTTSIVDAAQGVANISLSAANTATIAAAASPTRDKFNPRLRFVGYYDILMTRTGSAPASFRILEGAVYISDGVTV